MANQRSFWRVDCGLNDCTRTAHEAKGHPLVTAVLALVDLLLCESLHQSLLTLWILGAMQRQAEPKVSSAHVACLK